VNKKLKKSEHQEEFITAVEQINKFHGYTDLAELLKEEHQRLVDYEKDLTQKRNTDAQNQWELFEEQVNSHFDKNQYGKAVKLISNIEKYTPYLQKKEQKKCKDFINLINSENEQWEEYKRVFNKLKNKFIKAFEDHAVNSSIVTNSQKELVALENLAKIFIKGFETKPMVRVEKDTILTIDELIQVIEFY